MTTEELERQYSPSSWSKRYSESEVIKRHVEFITERSEKVKKNIPNQLDNVYGASNQKYDIFGTHLPNDSPIFVYVHGGYWQELDRDSSSYVVEPLVNSSIKVIIVGYDLCPNVSLVDIIKQIQQAIKHILDCAEKTGSRGVYLSGHSAGAHLISSLFGNFFLTCKNGSMLKAAFLISGIYDLMPLVNTYVNKALQLDEYSAKNVSTSTNKIHIQNLKIFVVVGEFDSPAFQKQSELYFKELLSTNNSIEYRLIKNVDHFDIVEKLSTEHYELTQLIVSTIKQLS